MSRYPGCRLPFCSECDEENTCIIECGSDECNDTTITCPPNYACFLLCEGLDACDTTTIHCPDTYECWVECTGGVDACGDVELDCSTDGFCGVECSADTSVCEGMVIHCGENECVAECQGDSQPTVSCGDSCDCFDCSD
ncbi:MAG: hypothetical protein JRI68_19955 [Deltaproteobacteria bacterium]|nr:hypothetical protein [Deltaproteobacteria bacterium]